MAVETAMVSANCRKNVPVMPLMNAVGIKTEQRTSAIATNAPPTSVIALRAASRGLRPLSMWCSIASTTTMASSTTIPIARTTPKSETLLIENPKADIAAKVPINETGIAMSGMSAARQVWRKTSTTRTTSAIASKSVFCASWIDSRTETVGS